MTHITAGLLVLARAWASTRSSPPSGAAPPASAAVWWAGVAIGAFNLIPVLPLDGGNVVTSVLDRFLPGRARHVMIYASLVLTVLGAVVLALTGYRGLTVFLAFLLMMQLQMIFEEREDNAVSPFDDAAAALRDGDEAKAVRIVEQGDAPGERRARSCRRRCPTTSCAPARRAPPPAADRRPLERVRADEPARPRRPAPRGRRVRRGELRPHAPAAAGRDDRPRRRRARRRDDGDRTGCARRSTAARHAEGIATIIDRAPELATVRQRPDVVAMRRALQPTA